MRKLYFNYPEISFFIWPSTISINTFALLHDKEILPKEELVSRIDEIPGFLDKAHIEAADMPLFVLHDWSDYFEKSFASTQIMSSDKEQLIIDETGIDAAQQILMIDKPSYLVRRNNKNIETIRLKSGSFALLGHYPKSIKEFSQNLSIDDLEDMNDWQEVILPKDLFVAAYEQMLSSIALINLSQKPRQYQLL